MFELLPENQHFYEIKIIWSHDIIRFKFQLFVVINKLRNCKLQNIEITDNKFNIVSRN